MSDLIDFLKDMVMTLHLLDKKYRDTVPNVVAQMKFLVESSDDEPKRKRGRAKKMRLGKDGLYPTEGDHVRRWWKANKPEPRDDEVIPRPEDVKYRIGCLRTRETQLQMILILEIIALETLRPAGGAQESQFPGLESKTPSKQAGAENSKKRRKQDLSVLVDLHADRLCIWQSTTPDDIMAMAESQAKDGGENTLHPSSDPLKDFCVDIIIPLWVQPTESSAAPFTLTRANQLLSSDAASLRHAQPEAGRACYDLAPETKGQEATCLQEQADQQVGRCCEKTRDPQDSEKS